MILLVNITCNSSFSMTRWTNSSFNFSILVWKSLTMTWMVAVLRLERDSGLKVSPENTFSNEFFPINCFKEFTSWRRSSCFWARNFRLAILWQFPRAKVASDCMCPKLFGWLESSLYDPELWLEEVSVSFSVLKASQSVWDLFNLEEEWLSPFEKGSVEDCKKDWNGMIFVAV